MSKKMQLHQRQEYDKWVALGEGRSFRKAGKNSKYSWPTLARWAAAFGWKEKLKSIEETEENVVSRHLIRRSDYGTIKEVETLMGRISKMIDDCFPLSKETGMLESTFEVKTITDFVKLIQAQKDLLMLHKELTDLEGKGGKKSSGTKLADKITIFMKGMTDEQQLALVESGKIPVNDGRIGTGAGGVQDADYTEVSDGADSETD